MRKITSLRGFTLIEIVIVVALIAILSLGATLAYGKLTDVARLNSAIAASKQITDAINIKGAQNGVLAGAVALDPTGADATKVAPPVGDFTVFTTADTTGGGTTWHVQKTGGVPGTDYACGLDLLPYYTEAGTFGCGKL